MRGTQEQPFVIGSSPVAKTNTNEQPVPQPDVDDRSLENRLEHASANSSSLPAPIPPAPKTNTNRRSIAGYYVFVSDIGQVYGQDIKQRFLRLSQVQQAGDLDPETYLDRVIILLHEHPDFLIRLNDFLPDGWRVQHINANGRVGFRVQRPFVLDPRYDNFNQFYGVQGANTQREVSGMQVTVHEEQRAPAMGTWGLMTAQLPTTYENAGYQNAPSIPNPLAPRPFEVPARTTHNEQGAGPSRVAGGEVLLHGMDHNGEVVAISKTPSTDPIARKRTGSLATPAPAAAPEPAPEREESLAELVRQIRRLVPNIGRSGWLQPIINQSKLRDIPVDERKQVLRDTLTRLADPAQRVLATTKNKRPEARRSEKRKEREVAVRKVKKDDEQGEWSEQGAREDGATCSAQWCSNILLPEEEEVGLCEDCLDEVQEGDEGSQYGSDIELE
ncbi:hypothetical protein CB0940_10926 [Cercospora beticola]|uniref:Uncharacterized protein n=1 Tax=Cercospora beticola TaxID=122368 RepID=A0A2G5HDX7_CERBT|nr:hypothetical protein CB0940_10926 [Cercospora beticola]PIA90766.1 hypothetical protein CB0940_10926 [Cercospora beticola]WPB07733.1 hypothetical protein RHO25_012396 [Cercospora beticola]CAK1356459.1 unnamed protein product [Cercospora beticola]